MGNRIVNQMNGMGTYHQVKAAISLDWTGNTELRDSVTDLFDQLLLVMNQQSTRQRAYAMLAGILNKSFDDTGDFYYVGPDDRLCHRYYSSGEDRRMMAEVAFSD